MNFDGEKTCFSKVIDFRTLFFECIEQPFHRALSHLGNAVDFVGAFWCGGAECSQKARGGASEADMERGVFRRDFAGATFDVDSFLFDVFFDHKTELAQRLGHDFRIFAEERAGERDRAVAERGEQERTIGYAFRSGQSDRSAHGARERLDRKEVRKRHEETLLTQRRKDAKKEVPELCTFAPLREGKFSRFEAVAVVFPAFEASADFVPFAVSEGGFKTLELVLESLQGVEHLFAVLLENLDPHRGVACGDAGGVAQTAAGGIAPVGIFLREKTTQRGGERLGKMADVGNDFVVLLGAHRGDFGTQSAPELCNGFNGGGRGVFERCDETGATVKERF